jgi:hypothetical protein
MKGLAGLGAAALIAAAVALWFSTNPTVVTAEVRPLSPSADLPTFKPVSDDHAFKPLPQTNR